MSTRNTRYEERGKKIMNNENIERNKKCNELTL